jgi:hypothetical protein
MENSTRPTRSLFADLSCWITRSAKDAVTYVQVLHEAPGLAGRGELGLRMFIRYDGKLMYDGTPNPPVRLLQCHS